MLGITYVQLDMIIALYGYILFLFFFFFTHLYCFVRCLSMIVWTHAVLGVLYACICIFVFPFVQLSAIEHVSHGKASTNTLIIIITIEKVSCRLSKA